MMKNTQRIWRIYKIFISVFTAIVGALFIVQAWRIFIAGGKGGYTVPIISQRFSEIAIPVYLWIVAVAVGGVCAYAPAKEEKPKAFVETRVQLQRLYGRVKDGKQLPETRKCRRFRLALYIECVVVAMFALAIILWILLSKAYVPKLSGEFFVNHNAVVDRLIFIMPWVLGAAVNAYMVSAIAEKNRKQEIDFLKAELVKQVKAGIVVKEQSKAQEKSFEKLLLGLRIGFAVAAVLLLIIGVYNGGMEEVFKKAINICTQCIGLG
jgi:hypothetical protein